MTPICYVLNRRLDIIETVLRDDGDDEDEEDFKNSSILQTSNNQDGFEQKEVEASANLIPPNGSFNQKACPKRFCSEGRAGTRFEGPAGHVTKSE